MTGIDIIALKDLAMDIYKGFHSGDNIMKPEYLSRFVESTGLDGDWKDYKEFARFVLKFKDEKDISSRDLEKWEARHEKSENALEIR